ncbi:MAG: hypothetical protein NT004_15125 [Bacteroidetes bacterium]|nr:hypothetical protein [Bacteroidota bacterium]
MPDTVCVGTTKPYWVKPTPGSSYTWWINGTLQTPPNDTILNMTWNTVGEDTINVQETTSENCIGDVKTLLVHVRSDPPTVTPPVLNAGYCVEDINTAIYQPGGSYDAQTDISPPRPNYYLLPAGNTSLNLTIVQHSCPDTLLIEWTINFANATNLTGIGQISERTEPIYFQVGTNTITWTVTNSFGHQDYSVVLVVLPRPEIGDIPH